MREHQAYLINLSHEAGLSRVPLFLTNILASTNEATAFGHLGRYYVHLNYGLLNQFTTDRAVFRRIVLHELSHIRNRDINKTYFTVAIGWAFALVALLPMALDLLVSLLTNFSQTYITAWNIFWRLLLFVPLIYLTLNAILRARETYADVRASTWDNPDGDQSFDLSTSAPREAAWRSLWKSHPAPEERKQLVINPSRLLQQGEWDIFITGVIVTSFLSNITLVLGTFFIFTNPELNLFIEPDVLGIAFACLVVGIVGLGTWRAIFAQKALGERVLHTLRAGFILFLGLLLGQALSLTAYDTGHSYFTGISTQSTTINVQQAFAFIAALKTSGGGNEAAFATTTSTLSWNLILASLVLGLFLFLLLLLFLRWVATTANLWLELATNRPSPRHTYWLGFVLASIVLGVWFARISTSLQVIQALPATQSVIDAAPMLLSLDKPFSNAPSIIFNTAQDPLVCLAFLLIWTYPLAISLWQKKLAPVTSARWAFLEASNQAPLPTRTQPPLLQPLRALLCGLAGGLIFWGIDLLFIHTSAINPYTLSLQNSTTFYVILLQGSIAAIVAATSQRLGTFQALLAAFIAGCVMVPGVVIHTIVDQQMSITPQQVGILFLQIVNEGAFLALPLALIVSTLKEGIRDSFKRHKAAPTI